jgi:aspartate carbamoyltransferase catalytic subunit
MKRHLLSITDLSLSELEELTAPTLPPLGTPARPWGTMAFLFEQPSLRTASSFATAGLQVGLIPVAINARGHELRAGCDLADELHQLSFNAAAIVARCDTELAAGSLGPCEAPVLNAGDGPHEHPTQALIDLTALRQLGLEGKTVAMVGNLRDHRTQHSLLQGLRALGVGVKLIAPPGLAMAPRYAGSIRTLETVQAQEVDEALQAVDYIYLTPVQYWNVPHMDASAAFRFDLERARRVLRRTAKVLHPFPRHGELDPSLDGSVFNGYHGQVRLAVPVRVRLLRRLVC